MGATTATSGPSKPIIRHTTANSMWGSSLYRSRVAWQTLWKTLFFPHSQRDPKLLTPLFELEAAASIYLNPVNLAWKNPRVHPIKVNGLNTQQKRVHLWWYGHITEQVKTTTKTASSKTMSHPRSATQQIKCTVPRADTGVRSFHSAAKTQSVTKILRSQQDSCLLHQNRP